ncbi:succinylglutamate desuccinylase [Pantoea endophytica]
MNSFLKNTLSGMTPDNVRGTTESGIHWRWLGEGLLEMTPDKGYERVMVISAGIHGNETAPVEILDQILGDLMAGRLKLTARLLAVFGNPSALRAGKRYLEHDMNRMFGGRYRNFPSCYESERAQLLERTIAAFFAADISIRKMNRFHYDLHTAIRESRHPQFGLLPYQVRPYNAGLITSLCAAELDALVIHREPGGTFSHFTSEQFEVESCTLELGKAKPFGQNYLTSFSSVDNSLRAMLSGKQHPVRKKEAIRVFAVTRSLIKTGNDFRLHMTTHTPNFECFSQDTLLCSDRENEYRVMNAQEWILFPNPDVALGMRAGLVLEEIKSSSLPV